MVGGLHITSIIALVIAGGTANKTQFCTGHIEFNDIGKATQSRVKN